MTTPFPTLHTSRMLLRQLSGSDAPALLALYGNADFMRYSGTVPWACIEDANAYLAADARQREEGAAKRFGLQLSGALVGTCSLLNIHPQGRRCEIGYGLAPDYWGRGLAGEAVDAVVDYAFSALAMRRVQANVDPRNAASVRLLERLGFQLEGTLREHHLVNQRPADSSIFGLLDSDWAGSPIGARQT